MRALLLCLVGGAAFAQAEVKAPETEVKSLVATGCAAWAAPGLPEGPIALGYAEADLATGRRACPRTEVGLGARFGAIIDTPHFYGNLGVNGLLFGSWALNEKTELFATLEAVNFNYVQTALKATSLTLGNMTAGGTRVLYQTDTFVGALSGRLLLPTTFEIPGERPLGLEVGHVSTWRAHRLLEVHTYLGADVTVGLSAAASYPRVGAVAMGGAQLSPWSWASVVLDVSGRLGPVTYLAPTIALRFRVSSLGIELGATLPLLGTDRHDFIAGLRLTWRI